MMTKVTIRAAKQTGAGVISLGPLLYSPEVEMEFDFASRDPSLVDTHVGLVIQDKDKQSNPPVFSSGETLYIERGELQRVLQAMLEMLK